VSSAATGDAAAVASFDDVARRGSPSFRLGRRSSATSAIAPVVGYRPRWTSVDDDDDMFHDEVRRASPSFRLGKRRVDGDIVETGTLRVLLPVDGQDGDALISSPAGQALEFVDDDAVNGADEQISLSARASPSFRLGKRGPSFRLGKRDPALRMRRGSPSFRLGKRGSDPSYGVGRQSSVVILPYYFRDLSDQERLDILQDGNMYRSLVDIDDTDDVDSERDLAAVQDKRTATFRLGKRDNVNRQAAPMTSSSVSSAPTSEEDKRSVSFRLGKRAAE
jgi:hypothetical protein